ncbi:hypothetical protein GCM10010390_83960 [Streptomyces mordarskii]|uniref:Uncharacterized protein n=1 Tax=Streptomyces mordarskii TaxID=1226758 RepID=A0ABP3PKW2_9ACTN
MAGAGRAGRRLVGHRPRRPAARRSRRPGHRYAKGMRGGSYLCHQSYRNRYRVAARTSDTPRQLHRQPRLPYRRDT